MIFMSLLLAACAIGYQARGNLSDVPGELRGKGFPGNASGGGRFILADSGGRLQCDGQLSPPDISPNPGSCAGEAGKGVVRCNDGREMAVRWTATTCRSFEGSGEDKFGNRLIFRVDRRN
ncbi:hypothetical protein [Ferribacterium limneticum]|uniref:hypothetical protein n=1 Tax=Ferribacterium limneticum TaxID=76259 RepID=UPI001CFA1BF5|nr:hypothetical protein [Ferribacterium limneticum]UCV17701.1 hypothetical protein KI610_12820 [Ferribacterium limneticum]